MSLRIYLGNLDPRVQQSELEDECRKFGKTTNVWVARNPPGFAFIVRSRSASTCHTRLRLDSFALTCRARRSDEPRTL